jgi:hypothetical protein
LAIELFAVLFLSMQDPPPMPPPLPHRPPPLSNGYAVTGVLGQGCEDQRDAEGRWSNDETLEMLADQRHGFRLISPDFAPRIVVIDLDGKVLAQAQGEAGPEGASLIFASPPERGDRAIYRLRAETIEPGATGRWRLAIMLNGDLNDPFTTQPSFLPIGPGCQSR